MQQDDLRKLVKRDVAIAAGGSVIAIWLYSLVAGVQIGAISKITAGRVEVAVGLLVSLLCVAWWAAGPTDMRRDRLFVLIPLFLIAGPMLIGVHNLGGGLIVAGISAAVGFGAAMVLGVMWGSRKYDRA